MLLGTGQLFKIIDFLSPAHPRLTPHLTSPYSVSYTK